MPNISLYDSSCHRIQEKIHQKNLANAGINNAPAPFTYQYARNISEIPYPIARGGIDFVQVGKTSAIHHNYD